MTIEAANRNPAVRALTEQELDAVSGGATALDGLMTVADLIGASMFAAVGLMLYTVGAVSQLGRTPQPSAW